MTFINYVLLIFIISTTFHVGEFCQAPVSIQEKLLKYGELTIACPAYLSDNWELIFDPLVVR